MKVNAIKDGKGNIVITEDSFEMLLACLDNQKYINEAPQNGDGISMDKEDYEKVQQDNQKAIDDYNHECRKILHQSYVFETLDGGYYLTKRYEHQDKITPWEGEDVGLVYEIFKDTAIEYEMPKDLIPLTDTDCYKKGDEPLGKDKDGWIYVKYETRPWLIERPMQYDHDYLTISEDGKKNRPWKQEEIDNIKQSFKNK